MRAQTVSSAADAGGRRRGMRTPSSPSMMRPSTMAQHAHRTDEQKREGNADDQDDQKPAVSEIPVIVQVK